jgi:hypothetical protein
MTEPLTKGGSAAAVRRRPADSGSRLLRFASSSDAGRYDRAFQSATCTVAAHEAALARERAAATRLLDELLRLPQGRRLLLLANRRDARSWALCASLVDLARAHHADGRPRLAEELATLALVVAVGLDPDYYGAERVDELALDAWRVLAAVRRACRHGTATGWRRAAAGAPDG